MTNEITDRAGKRTLTSATAVPAPGRRFRWRLWVIGALILTVAGFGLWSWNRTRGPNVLLITLDTTRADHLRCYGYKGASTPCLDRLAREGVQFDQAITNVPLTLPSHATMLTGLLPAEHGLLVNAMGKLPDHIPTLAERLAARGYRTGAFLAAFVLDHQFGLNRGFDVYDDDLSGANGTSELQFGRRRKGDVVVGSALKWLNQSRGSWGIFRKPYFCWVHLYDPHHPCDEHRDEFDVQFAGRAYDAEIAYADRQIERLLSALRESGELENTLIVVAGDHGEGLGKHMEDNHGLQLYQSTLHVPLLFHWPEHFAADHHVAEPVPLVDLTPTILDALKLDPLKHRAGRSLLPALTGQPIDARPVLSETNEPYYEIHAAPQQSLVFDGWKYIHSPEAELYRLTEDPGETRNLAKTESAKLRELADLRREIYSHLNKGTAASVTLDQQTKNRLKSFGYAGGTWTLPEESALANIQVDVKEMLLPLRLTQSALSLRDSKPEEAERHLKLVAERHPKFHKGRMHYAETLAQRADVTRDDPAIRRATFEHAVSICQEIIKDEKNEKYADLEKTWEAHLILAGALERLGQVRDADEAYEEAVKIQPENAKVHVSFAMSLKDRGRLADAAAHLEIATGLDPFQSTAQYELAKIRLSQGDVAEALKRFRLAATHNPRLLDAHRQFVQILRSQKKWPEAIAQLKRVLEVFANDANVVREATRLLEECQQQR